MSRGGHFFEKGRSGNPGGRPRTKWLRQMVEEWTPKLAAEMFKIATTSKSEERRIAATELLWNRAFGKPALSIDVEGGIALCMWWVGRSTARIASS
jgi:Family of unknown function (DUF5681)